MVPLDERLEEGVEDIDTDTAETISQEPVIRVVNEALIAAGNENE